MKDFRTLKVWEKAHALTLAIYEPTRRNPQNAQRLHPKTEIQPPNADG
jgi:hypothetical protein